MDYNPFSQIEDRLSSIESLIVELKQQVIDHKPERTDLVRTHVAAEYCGLKDQTIRLKASRNEVPHMRVGNKLWFSLDELDQWIRSKRVKTNGEIEEEAERHLKKLQRK